MRIADNRLYCTSCRENRFSDDGFYDKDEEKLVGGGGLKVYERPGFLRLDKIQINRAIQEVKGMQTDQDIRDYYLKKYYPDMTKGEINQAIKDINKEALIRAEEEKGNKK